MFIIIIVFWVFCSITAYHNIIAGYKITSFVNPARCLMAKIVSLFGPIYWFSIGFTKYITIPIIKFFFNLSETLNPVNKTDTIRISISTAIESVNEAINFGLNDDHLTALREKIISLKQHINAVISNGSGKFDDLEPKISELDSILEKIKK